MLCCVSERGHLLSEVNIVALCLGSLILANSNEHQAFSSCVHIHVHTYILWVP